MHNNIPIEIPNYPYVLLNRTVLCNCIESISACDPDSTGVDFEMYDMAKTAF